MLKILGWTATVGVSFYAGIMYCGWHLIDVPDSKIIKIITFIKTVEKISGVF